MKIVPYRTMMSGDMQRIFFPILGAIFMHTVYSLCSIRWYIVFLLDGFGVKMDSLRPWDV